MKKLCALVVVAILVCSGALKLSASNYRHASPSHSEQAVTITGVLKKYPTLKSFYLEIDPALGELGAIHVYKDALGMVNLLSVCKIGERCTVTGIIKEIPKPSMFVKILSASKSKSNNSTPSAAKSQKQNNDNSEHVHGYTDIKDSYSKNNNIEATQEQDILKRIERARKMSKDLSQ